MLQLRPIAAGVLLASLAATGARANPPLPTGEQIRHGNVTIQRSATQMNVGQASAYGIIDWSTFDVGAGHGVHFDNGMGATLNRVTGFAPSTIDGALSATGSLYLLNRNGVIIGADGTVLTGGDFVGSTLDLSNADFLDGGAFTLFGNGQAEFTNLGQITSSGGDVFLTGYAVNNEGSISAPEGRVGLAAGTEIDVLTDVSWQNGAFAVSLGERGGDVTNEGRIEAMVAELRTHGGNIYALAGNNDGLIHATGVRNQGGKVFLVANEGLVQSSGIVRAEQDGDGGEIQITAARVENYGGVQDVSGANGGTIAIDAGDVITDTTLLAQGTAGSGGDIVIRAEERLMMTAAGVVRADGTVDGGRIALDSGAGQTVLSGDVTATGAIQGGQIGVTGATVSLLGATVSADGGPLGGTIRIGGGWQGGSAWPEWDALHDVLPSERTYVSETTLLSADAGLVGRGGEVVVWSDGVTEFAGTILARGGIAGGDGGRVETSGLEGLGVAGTVDASARAAYGRDGEWLLDPRDIVIDQITDSVAEFQRIVGPPGGTPRSPGTSGAGFGFDLAIDGTTMVVGTDTGLAADRALYVFENGRIAARLTAGTSADASGELDFNFGQNVATLGDYIAATSGASGFITPSPFTARSGALFVYRRGEGWQNGAANRIAALFNPDRTGSGGQRQGSFGAESENLAFRYDNEDGTALSLFVSDSGFDGGFTSTAFSSLFEQVGERDVGRLYQYSISGENVSSSPSVALEGTTAFQGIGRHLDGGANVVYTGSTTGGVLALSRFGNVDVAVGAYDTLSGDDAGFAVKQNVFVQPVPGGSSQRAAGLEFRDVQIGTGGITVGDAIFGTLFTPGLPGGADRMAYADGLVLLSDPDAEDGRTGVGSPGFVAAFAEPAGGWGSCSTIAFCTPFLSVSGATANSFAGASLDIGSNSFAFGSPAENIEPGTVHFYTREAGAAWSTATASVLKTADPDFLTGFGDSVALDGNTLAIAAPSAGDPLRGDNQGEVFVYEDGALAAILNPVVSVAPGLLPFFGRQVALDGDALAVSRRMNSGADGIELFLRGAGWRNGNTNFAAVRDLISAPNPGLSALTIEGLALDAGTLAVGTVSSTVSANVSQVLLFENQGSFAQTLAAAPLVLAQNEGAMVALNGDTAVVGHGVRVFQPEADNEVFVFERGANGWATATSTRLDIPGAGALIGSDVDVSGDTVVVGSFSNGNDGAVHVFERVGNWASSSAPVAALQVPTQQFGYSLALDGDLLVTSANGGGGLAEQGLHIFEKQSGWRDGSINRIAFIPMDVASNAPDRLDLSGNRIAVRPGSSVTNAAGLQVQLFEGPFDLGARSGFALDPSGTLNIAASSLANSLSLGTNITLQANRDIFVRSAVTVDNPDGDGGDLALEAGRSILVTAPITTDDGSLTLISNHPNADPAIRGVGEGRVVLGTDASNAPALLTLGTGDLLIAGGDRFENRTGVTDPFRFDATNPGSWLVYSTSPDPTGALDLNNLALDASIVGRDFVQYGLAFDATDPRPASLPGGNGFVYAVTPTVGVNVGNASITYGETPDPALTLGAITVGGTAVSVPSAYSVTAAQLFGISAADLPNLVETGLAGSVGISGAGFANAGTFAGGLTATARSTVTAGSVFGVDIATGAPGDLTVAQRLLTASGIDFDKVYDATAAASLAGATVTGLLAGDAATVDLGTVTAAFDDEFVGVGKAVTISGAPSLDGADAGNYRLDFPAAATGDITALDLLVTGLTGVDRVYDATTDAQFTGTATIAPLALDASRVALGGTVTANGSFADANAATDKIIDITGFLLTGSHAANYNLIQPQGLTADVTPATLQVQGLTGQDRVYDATTAVSLNGAAAVTGFASDDVAVIGTAIGTFDDGNVGTDRGVNLAGLTLAGAAAGNYRIAAAAATSGITASITPADLLVTGFSAQDRVYDATTSATLSGSGAIDPLGADVVLLDASAVAGTFADKNAGTDKAVTVSGLTISGSGAGNYTLIAPQGLTADITPADLLLNGVVAEDRVYDATDIATLAGTPTVAPLAFDLVTVAGTPDARFDDKNAATGKNVTVTGYTLAGVDAANYTPLQPTGLTADVTPRPLSMVLEVITPGDGTVPLPPPDLGPGMIPALPPSIDPGAIGPAIVTPTNFAVEDRVYDATAAATFAGEAIVAGVLAGDDVVIDDAAFAIAFADKNAGVDKPIVVSGVTITGADAANYDATDASLFATITPADLNISGVTAADRVYDATTRAALSGGTLADLLAGDDVVLDVTGASGAFETRHIGVDKPVSASGYAVSGVDAANYQLVQPQGLDATITAATLNLVDFSGDKTYDGTTAAPLAAAGLDAVFIGDDVSADLAAITGSYADKNAATDKPIALNGSVGLGGEDAGNYVLNQPLALTGTIARRGITVIGLTIADKVYDGTVVGEISGTGTFGGTIAGDDLEIAVGAVDISFADANAGADKPVALSGITLSGADADNYDAATPTGITGTILQRALTVTGIAAEDRIYDRTTVATLTGTGALDNVISGDDVTLDETNRAGTFADENVGTDKPVTVSGLTLNGTTAPNYLLQAPVGITASITPFTLNLVGVAGVDRVYDATARAPLAGIADLDFGILGTVGPDDVTLAGTLLGAFADENVAEDKAITLSGVELGGTDAANYLLALPTDLLADVAPFALQVAGVSAEDRIYDATTVASLTGTPVAEFFAGDAVAIGGTPVAVFGDRNVGTAKPVTASGYALTGADAFNYTLAQPTGLSADISVADLRLTGIVADDRVYDGTTLAPLSGSVTIAPLGSDAVTLDGRIAAVFETKNVGSDKPVLLSGLTLAGIDAANYRLTLPSLVADVTPRSLKVTGLAGVDRVYDATTVASISGTGVLDDVVTGDAVIFDAAAISARFLDENAARAKPIVLTGAPLVGIDSANYALTLPADLTANVDPKPVAVLNATAVDRAYDATVDVAIAGGEAEGLIAGDAVSLATDAAAGTVPDRNVGEDKPVTTTGFELAGADAPNYLLSQPEGLVATLTPRSLEILGVEIPERFFDGTTDAAVSGGRLEGVIPGDNVNLDTANGEGAFLDPEVGDAKPVALTGFTISGEDAGNYALVDQPLAFGDVLPQPGLVTDIIPPEVLRQDAAQQTAQQRAALVEFAAAQANAITLIDYEALATSVITGVAAPEIIDGILDTLPEERDPVTQAYVQAAVAARNAVDAYNNDSAGYRTTARALKGLEQRFNQAQRELAVETGLVSDLAADVARTETVVSEVQENLARIAEAKSDREALLLRAAEADQIGRGSESAELRAMAAELGEMIDQEASVRAQLDETTAVLEEQQGTLDATEGRIAELEAETTELESDIAETETTVNNYRSAVAAGEARAEAAKEKLAEARAAGAAAYTEMAENLEAERTRATEELAGLNEALASGVAARTAEKLAGQDPVVQLYGDALADANAASEALAGGIEASLGSGARAVAEQLAADAAAGRLSTSPAELRDALVAAVPALQQAQNDIARLEAQQAALTERVSGMFNTNEAVSSFLLATGSATPEVLATARARDEAAMMSRIGELSGGLDLSNVPEIDASGAPIALVERLALAMAQKQLAGAGGDQADAAMAGYKARVSNAVAAEFGITPEEALADPSAALDVVADRVPTDVESAGQLATDAVVARYRLNGLLKDAAMEEAAAQDPTGTLSAINSVEAAAIGAFAEEYGMTPDEMVVAEIRRVGAERTQGAVDGVAAAQSGDLVGATSGYLTASGAQSPVSQALISIAEGGSPEEAFSNLPEAAQTPAVLEALQGMASGDSPEDVIAGFASASGGGDGANVEAARARRTAMAMQEAALLQASEVDPTGGVAAAMSVQAAADAEFAATFGDTPDELALQALEDPAAAASRLMDLGESTLSSPGATFEASTEVANTVKNMGMAQVNQAFSVLEEAAGPLGGVVQAAQAVADFAGDAVETLSFGLIDNGPSAAEVQQMEAFEQAQQAYQAAQQRQAENEAIADLLSLAAQIADRKLQLAQGVENAKSQVSGVVLAAKVTAERQAQYDTQVEVTAAALEQIVTEEISTRAEETAARVDALSASPEEIAAKAALWGGNA